MRTNQRASARPDTLVAAALHRGRQNPVKMTGVWVAIMLLGLAMPYVLGLYNLQLAVQGATLAILAMSVGWLLRQTGQLSFGHAAFYGIAGYTAAIVGGGTGVPTEVALLFGVLAATVSSLVIGFFIVRLPGIAFSMVTLAIGMLVWVASTQLRSLTNGFDGMPVPFEGTFLGQEASMFTHPVTAWPFVWVSVMVVAALLWLVSRSVFGRRLTAIRENQDRARFIGHSTYMPRVIAFTISGTVAGLAGAIAVLNLGFISPEQLYWDKSGLPLIVAIIGGVSSVAGPVVGAMIFTFLQAALAGSSQYQIIIGIVMMFVVIVAPGGGADVVKRIRKFIVRRWKGDIDA
jgi:branched-chain amino acid transport system permease protein